VILFKSNGFKAERLLFKNQKKLNVSLKEKPLKDTVIIAYKPLIYLYPTKKTDIELNVNFNGEILTTFPKLENSWQVTAHENGQIFDKKTKRLYSTLFWDGSITFPKEHYQYKDGFVVEKENLTIFLIEKLEYMGLNTTETNEFVQYWLPILEKNQTNFIHFLVNEKYDVISTNTINPKPDTSLRIFMEFYGISEKLEIQPQNLPKTERKGFTLVEWGGSDVSAAIKKNSL
jgi:hypothetical protein